MIAAHTVITRLRPRISAPSRLPRRLAESAQSLHDCQANTDPGARAEHDDKQDQHLRTATHAVSVVTRPRRIFTRLTRS